MITSAPNNNNLIWAACNTVSFIPFFVSEGIYITTDGGETWYGSDTCQGDPVQFHGGDPGIAITPSGRLVLTRLGRSPFTGLYAHYSDDMGLTWSPQTALSTDDLERASLVCDLSGGIYSGNLYAAWVKFAAPWPVMFSSSTDGTTWSTPQQINNPVARCAGGDLAVGAGGTLYLCWATVSESSPFYETAGGFARSDDAGQNWIITEQAFPMHGITGILPEKQNIRVNGLPAISVDTFKSSPYYGRIYIVSAEKEIPPAGNDPDILLRWSDDQGTSWSDAIRVNQDTPGNGKTQYFPAIETDRGGGVNILFYDDRYTSPDSVDVLLARSVDGGNSWKEYPISNETTKPVPIGGLGQGYQGDRIDLTIAGNTLWPVWMDNRTGIYQIWTAPVDLDDLSNAVTHAGLNRFLVSFSPVPFKNNLSLRITGLAPRQDVELEIFMPTGIRCFHSVYSPVSTTIGQELFLPGKPGILFYRIRQANTTVTGKLLRL
ncbi:MAG: hypothetical protein Kow00127_17780 [Bacteroidales bacterium]